MKTDTAANATADVFRCSIIANTHQLHAAKAKTWEWLQSTSPLTIAAFGASGRQVAPGCDSRLSCRVAPDCEGQSFCAFLLGTPSTFVVEAVMSTQEAQRQELKPKAPEKKAMRPHDLQDQPHSTIAAFRHLCKNDYRTGRC